MKTLSLKMLLVAALVVSPVVVMADNKDAAQEQTTTTTTPVETPAAEAQVEAPADKSVSTEEGYFSKAKTAVSGAAAAVVAFPSDVYAWATENKKNTVAAAIITAFVAKEAYAYMTAPAKVKAVKTTDAN